MQVLADAVALYGKPEIINSDQGSQYTSIEWTRYVEAHLGIKKSMDGEGRALDNVWIERFWKTIKYDHFYLHPTDVVLNFLKEFRTTSATITKNTTKP